MSPASVILFDGFCNLCSNTVQFVIRHDPQHHFRFASLQGKFGKQLLAKHKPATGTDSLILFEKDRVYTRSTAALHICKKLNGLWPAWYAFIIVPAFIRDAVYDLVARNRYRWFGKKNSCWVPTKELQDLFFE